MNDNYKAVNFCQARCGGGKTRAALSEMATVPGLYIYAVDRREVAEGRIQTVMEMAAEVGVRIPIVEIIFSGTSDAGPSKPIAELIAEAIERNHRLDHAIVVVTHAGFKMTDHATYNVSPRRWHLIVDETPDLYEMRSMDTGPLMIPFLAAHFRISDNGSISLKRPISASEFERDALRPLRQFYDLVKRDGARASVNSWADTEKAWWISRTWDVSILNRFERATFYADSFSETITYHVLRDAGVTFEEVHLTDRRVWRDRRVTIQHYVSDHEASAGRFRDDAVKVELRKIARHLSTLKINDHLWTTNDEIAGIFEAEQIAGQKVSPKQAGANQWMAWHDATMIYAARPSPHEIIVHGKRGMSEDDLIKARGGYDIKQFAMRLSLRDPSSTAPVTVRVYDREQASALKDYLDATYGFECEIEHVDVGVMVPKRQRGRPKKHRTPEERALAKSIANAKQYAKAKRAA